jgi:hypothetical protein
MQTRIEYPVQFTSTTASTDVRRIRIMGGRAINTPVAPSRALAINARQVSRRSNCYG